ncbi:MAG: cyclodeaminase/cyclohydrolase family protein [Oscillospiraceae bacterium]|nr:cyclodeaminase/cyclohydrolase family protein [Oscillospiraceae bacterium]
MSIEDFIASVASKEPAPGGGAVSAVTASMGAALGCMVCNLTIGKKKYAAYTQDLEYLLAEMTRLTDAFQRLAQADETAFLPLSAAYRLPNTTEAEKAEKERVMEDALRVASDVPLEMMSRAVEAIKLHAKLCPISSALAISDVGAGVVCCKSALISASLNVFINTGLMKKRDIAAELNSKAERLIEEGTAIADRVLDDVKAIIERKAAK